MVEEEQGVFGGLTAVTVSSCIASARPRDTILRTTMGGSRRGWSLMRDGDREEGGGGGGTCCLRRRRTGWELSTWILDQRC